MESALLWDFTDRNVPWLHIGKKTHNKMHYLAYFRDIVPLFVTPVVVIDYKTHRKKEAKASKSTTE